MVGVSRQIVNQWMRNYACEGEKALLDRRLNTHRRGKGRLTDAEARRVQGWIKDKCPEQLKLPYALWTAGVVRELIHRRLGKHLGLSTGTALPAEMGIHAAKTVVAGHSTLGCEDPALA